MRRWRVQYGSSNSTQEVALHLKLLLLLLPLLHLLPPALPPPRPPPPPPPPPPAGVVTYYSGDFSPTLGTLSGEALLLLLPTPPSAPPGFPQRPALVGVLLARSTPSPLLPAEVDPPPDPASPCPCQHVCCPLQRLPPPSPPLSCYCLHSACSHQGCETSTRNRIFTQTHKPQVCPGNKNLLQ